MLRLGFLQCDSLDAPHVHVDGDYDALFAALLAGHDIELAPYRADRGELPASPRACDAWLIPGSRQSVFEHHGWIADLGRFASRVIDDGRPLVGVCFGHQLVAQVLGAPVARADAGWNIGAVDYHLRHAAPGEPASPPAGDRFDDAAAGTSGDRAVGTSGDIFTAIASHQDQVLEVPAGTVLFADAPTCPIAGLVGESVFTLQGHPEFTAPLARSIYGSRVERLGSEAVDAALASLDHPLDQPRVAHWIASFVAT